MSNRTRMIHVVTIAIVALFSSPIAHAAKAVVVFYLDSHYRPVVKIQRLGTMSEGEKAILAMYSLQKGGGCEGRSEEGMKCALTEALDMGAQCSKKHVQLVASWFKKGMPPMNGHFDQTMQEVPVTLGRLESICYDNPSTARIQDTWELVRLKKEDGLVLVEAISSWMEGPDGPSGNERYSTTYRVGKDEVAIVSHRKVK